MEDMRVVRFTSQYLEVFKELRLKCINDLRKKYGLDNVDSIDDNIIDYLDNDTFILYYNNIPYGYITNNKEKTNYYDSYVIDNDYNKKMILASCYYK